MPDSTDVEQPSSVNADDRGGGHFAERSNAANAVPGVDALIWRLTLAFVASRGVALPQGTHRVTIEKAGYFPWDRVVEAKDAPVRLDVALTPIPD